MSASVCSISKQNFSVALLAEFFSWARAELQERKLRRNVLSFDDLLTRLDDALAAPGGAELAKSIRVKYQAALIDEFQDTDPVQYSIFSRIYEGSNAPVAFIGDPKQAIYAFRGADVFTYMKAASERRGPAIYPNDQLALGKPAGRRSEHDLRSTRSRFCSKRSNSIACAPSPKADEKPLLIGGKQRAAIPSLDRGQRGRDLPETVASEVVRLLTSNATIGGEPLEPRHIAILTSTNGRPRRSRMPCALAASRACSTAAQIFSSRTKRASCATCSRPSRNPVTKNLSGPRFCTDALGRTGERSRRLHPRRPCLGNGGAAFSETSSNSGAIAASSRCCANFRAEHGVRRRLLGYPDGERRLTNFLHLAEILHARLRRASAGDERHPEMARAADGRRRIRRPRRTRTAARKRRKSGPDHHRAQEQGARVRRGLLPFRLVVSARPALRLSRSGGGRPAHARSCPIRRRTWSAGKKNRSRNCCGSFTSR